MDTNILIEAHTNSVGLANVIIVGSAHTKPRI